MPVVGSNVRTYELAVGGYFAGISGGGILIARKKDWKIFRASRRHMRRHEGMYIGMSWSWAPSRAGVGVMAKRPQGWVKCEDRLPYLLQR
jgi:hypothetical protein